MPRIYRVRGQRHGTGQKSRFTVVYQTTDGGQFYRALGSGASAAEAMASLIESVRSSGRDADHLDRQKQKR